MISFPGVDVVVREGRDLLGVRQAVFSPEDPAVYRYALYAQWGDDESNVINFLMLNPSTADHTKNDPTLERCQRRASKAGFDGMIITNLFAYRSTDPNKLYMVDDPIGPLNDIFIDEVAKRSKVVVAAWGSEDLAYRDVGTRGRRAPQIVERFTSELFITLHAIDVARGDKPKHPLYLPYDKTWHPWKFPII